MKSHACLLAIVGLWSLGVDVQSEQTFVEIDAAYSYNQENSTEVVNFFIGNQVHLFRGGHPLFVFDRKELNVPADMKVQAAFTLGGQSGDRRIYYGDQYGYSVYKNATVTKEWKLKYGEHRDFIRNGGPDAVGRTGDNVYVFKGCNVVTRDSYNKWGDTILLTGMGLPCDVHAAWAVYPNMYVLKGDKVWIVDGSFTVIASNMPFENYYILPNDMHLKPIVVPSG